MGVVSLTRGQFSRSHVKESHVIRNSNDSDITVSQSPKTVGKVKKRVQLGIKRKQKSLMIIFCKSNNRVLDKK